MRLTIDHGLKETLKPELARLNSSLEQLAKAPEGFLGDLLSYVLIGSGKRVRPALVILASRLGSPKNEDVHTVAMAAELVHIATLVHDDVIDKAVLRRQRKTVASEHGVDAAVLLGDHIYTHAFEKVAELKNPLLIQLLAKSTSIMCAGEIEQLKKRFEFNLTEEEYFSFIGKKTASLFGTSARAGAVLAGQPLPVQTALEEYGYNLGIAFQITDDLLDITGEEAIVGKTLRTDLLNGKMTLPLIHFRDQLSSKEEAGAFFESLQHPNGQIQELAERMQASGSIRYAEQVAEQHIQTALAQLNHVPTGAARDHLSMLAEMLLNRKA